MSKVPKIFVVMWVVPDKTHIIDFYHLILNPNSEGVPATHLSEGGADSAPPLVNAVLMAQMS